MEDLVDTVGHLFDRGPVRQMSSLVKEDEGHTRRAIETAVPVSIAGLASQASSEDGARSLLQTLQSGRYPHLELADLDEALADPIAATRVALSGESFLGRMFGARLDDVLDGLAGAAGVSRASATRLLGLAMPLVMNLVSKRAAAQHLDAHGLAGFLGQQENFAAGHLPDRMNGLLGTPAAEIPQRGVAHRRFWPWLVPAMVAAGAMGWWANRHTRREIAQPVSAPVTAPAPPVKVMAPPAVPRAEPQPAVAPPPAAPAPVVAVAEGAIGPFQLAAERGVGDLPQRFVLQGLEFQTNSAALLPATTRVLDDIANVMTANPAVAVRAEGYTDDTGFPDDNLALSTDRANAVKDYLVSRGIAADRITTTGLGSEQPIAPNDTAQGRAMNRRTEIVLLRR